jgi:hypothetical protein
MLTDNSVLENQRQNRKIASLPPDLKKIAQELIDGKEGVVRPSPQDVFIPPQPQAQYEPPKPWMTNEPLYYHEIEQLKQVIQFGRMSKFYNSTSGEKPYQVWYFKRFFRDSTGFMQEFAVTHHDNPPVDWWAEQFVNLLKSTGKKWSMV